MAYELPALGYDFDDLEPTIDARTMEIHHGKHHAGYVAKLNAALEGHDDLAAHSVADLAGIWIRSQNPSGEPCETTAVDTSTTPCSGR